VTTGRALVPTPGGSRRAHLREWRRESLWLWPAVAALVAWAAGDLAARYLHNFSLHQGAFPTDLDDARTLLATIAAALLTFTGVVFSITLVALQMASTQYSPRVLRTFVRKPVTKLALSTFIATFVYALALLARVGSTTRAHTVPQGAVAVAYLLVMASVLVFVFFVHSTVRSMRVSYVIEAVFVETSRAMDVLFAPLDTYREVTMPERQSATASIAFDRRDAVIDGIDAHRLVELATQHQCILECSVPVGTFVTSGSQLVRVHGGSAPEGREVLTAFNCSAVRTLYQDPCYGIRQLVDIAIRALSPAVNDPTTAVQTLDRLHALVRAVVARPDPSGCYVDASDVVRLVVPVPGWDRVVGLAFTEIALYGSDAPQISRKLTAVFDDLAELVGPDRIGAIDVQRAALREAVRRARGGDEGQVLVGDPLGLG
jgi:uncharacterized membrane protein